MALWLFQCLITVECLETCIEGGKTPLVASFRNFSILLKHSLLWHTWPELGHILSSLIGKASLLGALCYTTLWAGAALRALASLSGNQWHWFIFQCINRDFSHHWVFFFPLTFSFPPFHHCHSELVNIGSSARYPISLFAMQAGLVVLSISCCVDCYRNFSTFSGYTSMFFWWR